MARQIFINLPIKDVKRSIDFFSALGFEFNPQFTNDKAACMIINELSYVMLLEEAFFQTFTKKTLIDATQSTEVILSYSVDSREAVDHQAEIAKSKGAILMDAKDHGWMYQQNFDDLDGHHWEVGYMDLSLLEQSIANETQQSN
jgi:predicted lactoylglutathione lyase